VLLAIAIPVQLLPKVQGPATKVPLMATSYVVTLPALGIEDVIVSTKPNEPMVQIGVCTLQGQRASSGEEVYDCEISAKFTPNLVTPNLVTPNAGKDPITEAASTNIVNFGGGARWVNVFISFGFSYTSNPNVVIAGLLYSGDSAHLEDPTNPNTANPIHTNGFNLRVYLSPSSYYGISWLAQGPT